MPTAAFNALLVTLRQTAAAHASALDELERAFAAGTAKTIPILILNRVAQWSRGGGKDMPTTSLKAILVTVRQTAAAHASVLNELERAFTGETVIIILTF
jgi:hypothetical protein